MDDQGRGEPAQPRRRSLATGPRGPLPDPAAGKDQNEPRADRGRRGEAEDQVGRPANPAIAGSTGPTPTGGDQTEGSRHGDCGHGGTGPRGRTLDPPRRMGTEEQHGQSKDDDEPRENEAESTDHRTEASTETPGEVDGQLGRGGAREEVGGGDAVFELASRQPPAPFDAQLAEERDVCRRAAAPEVPT